MGDDGIDLYRIIGLLRRRIRLILACILILTSLAAVVSFALTPIYSSSVLILVDPSLKNLLDPQDQGPAIGSESSRVDSEVELVTSDANLLSVISDMQLLSDPEFGVRLDLRRRILAFFKMDGGELPSGKDALADVLANVGRAVSARRVGLTFLISVEARSTSPDKAAELANRVAQVYIRSQINAKIDSTLQARDVLQAKLTDASTAVSKSEGAFDSFIDTNMNAIVTATGRNDLETMRQQILATEGKRQELTDLIAESTTNLQTRDFKALAQSLQSAAVQNLEQQREQLQTQLAATAPTQSVDLRAELANIEKQLEAAASQELGSLRQAVADDQKSSGDMRQQLRSLVVRADLPSDILTKVYEIQQESEIARTQYQNLLTRLKDLEAQAGLQVADSRIVSEALAPNKPAFPNAAQIVGVTGVLATILGVALAVVYENYVGGITNSAQFESVLRMPVAAAVPRQRGAGDTGRQGDGPSAMMVTAPFSPYAEGVRSIRIAVDQARRLDTPDQTGQGTVIMVTSTVPGEGKTTLALSLARAYALSNVKTLLIDCDFRRPRLHEHLGLVASTGLAERLYTGAGTPLEQLAVRDELTSLSVIVGARPVAFSTDQLVSGEAFAALIAEAKAQFDIVVLDTAPVAPIVDTLYVARVADTIVYVVAAGETSQRVISAAKGKLEANKRASAQTIGVLNFAADEFFGYNKYQSYYQTY